MNKSIPVISSALQFVDLQPLDISPLISECTIKVLYVGENRNGSYISKDTALNMAKGLRGNPIIGYYKEEKGDFRDHGEKITIDGDSFNIVKQTKPYGFISPAADVWFQVFEDDDQAHPGKKIQHEYMMTTGYLWTGRYPECAVAVNGDGRPQSMELHDETLQGHWSMNPDMDFFIIDAADISALTILGEDIEPCFEGASVTKRDFALEESFQEQMLSMLNELKFALQQKGDLKPMNENENIIENEFNEKSKDEVIENEFSKNEEIVNDSNIEENFKKKEDKEDDKESEDNPSNEEEDKEESKDDTSNDNSDSDDDDEEKKKKYELLEQNYSLLKNDYDELQAKYNELVDFKNAVEDAKKDAIIAQFAMLSDEDKKSILENKRSYTCEQVEEKLAAICFRKKINFVEATIQSDTQQAEEKKEQETFVTTFNIEDTDANVPAYIKALTKTQQSRK